MALFGFLVRRILTGIVVIWLVATGAFFLFFARPVTTVAHQLAGRAATPQVINEVISNLGLNRPIMVQYWHFLDGLLHGNLGYSYYNQEAVTTMLKQDLPPTISLVIGGVILWLVVGLSVGIISATRARSLFDRTSSVAVLIGLSMPVFVIGELLILVVFVPSQQHGFTWIDTGYSGISEGFLKWMGHMILPWITLAAVQAAVYTRLMRGQLLDTMGEDYIRTARSTTMLAITTNAAAIMTKPMITGRLSVSMASTETWPMPPRPKTASTTTTPPSSWPMSTPSWDTTGVRADLTPCLNVTRRSDRPLDLAVLM